MTFYLSFLDTVLLQLCSSLLKSFADAVCSRSSSSRRRMRLPQPLPATLPSLCHRLTKEYEYIFAAVQMSRRLAARPRKSSPGALESIELEDQGTGKARKK